MIDTKNYTNTLFDDGKIILSSLATFDGSDSYKKSDDTEKNKISHHAYLKKLNDKSNKNYWQKVRK